MRKTKKAILFILILFIGFVLYTGFTITNYANKSYVVTSDAAIVLGAAIKYDQPSPVFRERINYGIKLYKTGVVKKLIFTGGFGEGQAFSESEVARMYAVNAGVKKSDILLEKNSTITYENVIEAKKILIKNNINTALIVSDPLHMKRAMTMVNDLGVNAKTAPTSTSMYKTWSSKFSFLAREVCFYIIYIIQKPFL